MRRRVSPMFALIVVLFALAVGALWFMVSYRAHEAREAALARMLQQERDQAVRSGRRGPMGARTGPRRAPGGGEGGASSRAPDEAGGGDRASRERPAGD